MESWLCRVALAIALAISALPTWSESAESVNWKAWYDYMRSLTGGKPASQTLTKQAFLYTGFNESPDLTSKDGFKYVLTDIDALPFINPESGEISFDRLDPQHVLTEEGGFFDLIFEAADGSFAILTNYKSLPNSQDVPITVRLADSGNSSLFRTNDNPMYDISMGITLLNKANGRFPNTGNAWLDLLYPQVGPGWDTMWGLDGMGVGR